MQATWSSTEHPTAAIELPGTNAVCDGPAGRVTMETVFGGARIVDMLVGEQLPRIC